MYFCIYVICVHECHFKSVTHEKSHPKEKLVFSAIKWAGTVRDADEVIWSSWFPHFTGISLWRSIAQQVFTVVSDSFRGAVRLTRFWPLLPPRNNRSPTPTKPINPLITIIFNRILWNVKNIVHCYLVK